MERLENQYKLKASDFIPIKGWFDYLKRADSPPALGICDDLKNVGRGLVLGAYNLVLLGSLVFTTWKGLELLIKN